MKEEKNFRGHPAPRLCLRRPTNAALASTAAPSGGTSSLGTSRPLEPCSKGEHSMVSAFVLVNVQRGEVNETAQRLLEIEGVSEVYSVTGEYDLVALLRFQNYEDL